MSKPQNLIDPEPLYTSENTANYKFEFVTFTNPGNHSHTHSQTYTGSH